MQNSTSPNLDKDLKFGEEARVKLKTGIDLMARAVRATLGPRGRNVILDRLFEDPIITNDGVTIAKEIKLKDRFENIGVQLLRKVAEKTNDEGGDGTTSAIILAHAMIEEGMKMVTGGVDPMSIKRGMDAGTKIIIEALNKIKRDINTPEDLVSIATLASEDPEAGRLIAEVVQQVGKDGVVTIEESQTFGISKDFVEGLKFEKGYISQYFITDIERSEAEVKDPLVLVTDMKLISIQDIEPLMQKVARKGAKQLVVIADSVDGEALATLIVNKLKGKFEVLAIDAPGTALRKKELLQDIATVVGAKMISSDTGVKLENLGLEELGQADRVLSERNSTIIVGGRGNKEDIEKRIKSIELLIKENKDNPGESEYLKNRIAKLKGGVGIIRIGAASETEMIYKKAKFEDAINSTKAALEEGIIQGGGTAFIRAIKMVKDNLPNMIYEEMVGINIVLKAIQIPLKQLAINSGIEDVSILKDYCFKQDIGGWDFRLIEPLNLDKAKVPDMYKAGIIDSVKVVRCGLENASSIAGIFLTTDPVVCLNPKAIDKFMEKL